MEFCLKWVHMARYELILRLDGALWLGIIFQDAQFSKKNIFTMDNDTFSSFGDFQISGFWKFRYMDFRIVIWPVEFDMKWVHMARYELILRLDGAL